MVAVGATLADGNGSIICSPGRAFFLRQFMQFDKTLRTAESSHNPESPSEKGQKLRRTTLSVLVMTILDDQICHVMFTGKNNGVLPF